MAVVAFAAGRCGLRAPALPAGGGADLGEKTVAFLCPSDSTYAHVQWGVWRAGGVAVPLSPKHPKDELDYFLSDCGAALVVGHSKYESVLRPVTEAQGKAYVVEDGDICYFKVSSRMWDEGGCTER